MHKVEMRHQENGEAEEELVVSNLRPFTLKARAPLPAPTACAPRTFATAVPCARTPWAHPPVPSHRSSREQSSCTLR